MKLLPEEPNADMYTAYYNVKHSSLDIDSYKAMYKAAPEVEQEPYAYATLWDNGEWSVLQEIDKNAVRQVPLYTCPQPKREPLSSNCIAILWNKAFKDANELSFVIDFVRKIEKELQND